MYCLNQPVYGNLLQQPELEWNLLQLSILGHGAGQRRSESELKGKGKHSSASLGKDPKARTCESSVDLALLCLLFLPDRTVLLVPTGKDYVRSYA